MNILRPVSSTRLTLIRFPDHKESISINKPFLGFPRKPSASDPFPSFSKGAKRCKTFVHAKLKGEHLASITSSVGVNALPVVQSPPRVGSPLFWIGVAVGVSVSALYSWVVAKLKLYATQQALKTMAGQINTKNYHSTLQKLFSVGDAVLSSNKSATPDMKDDSEPRIYSVVDVSPEETSGKRAFGRYEESSDADSSYKDAVLDAEHIYPKNAKGQPPRAVEALEKVLGDPAVQTIAMDVINKLFTAL